MRWFKRRSDNDLDGELVKRIEQAAAEAEDLPYSGWRYGGAARETETGKALLAGSPEESVELIFTCFAIVAETRSYTARRAIANDLAAAALRRKLPLGEDDDVRLLDAVNADGNFGHSSTYCAPRRPLGRLDRARFATASPPAALHPGLSRIGERVNDHKLRRRIEALTGAVSTDGALPPSDDPWTHALLAAARDDPRRRRGL